MTLLQHRTSFFSSTRPNRQLFIRWRGGLTFKCTLESSELQTSVNTQSKCLAVDVQPLSNIWSFCVWRKKKYEEIEAFRTNACSHFQNQLLWIRRRVGYKVGNPTKMRMGRISLCWRFWCKHLSRSFSMYDFSLVDATTYNETIKRHPRRLMQAIYPLSQEVFIIKIDPLL